VWALKEEIDRDGIVSKVRVDKYGRRTGGKPVARGALYLMLQNRIYRGEIVHKENSYPGQHEVIVDEDLWDAVQEKLAANRIDRETGANAAEPSPLAGLVFDETGARMMPSHANKKGTRYRYYVSRGLVRGRRADAPRGRRVPAGDLEAIVADRLCRFLASESEVYEAIEPLATEVGAQMEIVARAAGLASCWSGLPPVEKRAALTALVERIDLLSETVEIHIRPGRIAAIQTAEANSRERSQSYTDDEANIVLSVPARLKRTGMETRLLIEGSGSDARRKPDHSLYRVLVQAQRYRAMVMQGGGKSMSELAAEAGVGSSYFSRILRLGFLGPDVITAILRDRHPLELTAKRLANDVRLPMEWDDQRTVLGID